MKLKSLLLLICISFSILSVHAQINLDLSLSDYKFIRYEPVIARVLMRNDSGRPLVFGDSNQLRGELFFEIVDSSGKQIQLRDKKIPEIPQILLKSGQTSDEYLVDLNEYYNLSGPGSYRIYCWITHPMLTESYKSPKTIPFIVEAGQERWRVASGFSDLLAKKSDQKVHKMYYVLLSIYKHSCNSLYIQIEDDNKIYALRKIGEELGKDGIDKDVDRFSNLHMIIPLSTKVYRYLVVTLDGKIEKTELYRKGKYIPRLGRDENTGRVFIAGGEKAIPGVDYVETQEQGTLKADGSRGSVIPNDIPAGQK